MTLPLTRRWSPFRTRRCRALASPPTIGTCRRHSAGQRLDQDAAHLGLLERLHAALRLGDSVPSEHDPGGRHTGATTALTWKPDPDNFFFIDADLDGHAPGSTPPGSITFQAGITVNISGTVTYCSNPSLNPVPDVTLTMTGNAASSTLSDGSGNYTFSSLPSGGSFTVTPTKAALAPGAAGINTVDVVATQRHFLNVTPLPPGCR